MLLECFVGGRARSNAYLFAPTGEGACVIVDPGAGVAERLAGRIRSEGLRPEAILLTHGHPDHVWSARRLSDAFEIPVYLHPADWGWLADPFTGRHYPLVSIGGRLVGRLRRLRPARLCEVDAGELTVAGTTFTVLHTPGHTAGGVCYLTDDVCFTGDTAFAGTLGHTTYPGGHKRLLRRSVRLELLGLADGARLYPGHGAETSVGRERARWEDFARGDRER